MEGVASVAEDNKASKVIHRQTDRQTCTSRHSQIHAETHPECYRVVHSVAADVDALTRYVLSMALRYRTIARSRSVVSVLLQYW